MKNPTFCLSVLALLFSCVSVTAQFIIKGDAPSKISLHPHAQIANAGSRQISYEDVVSGDAKLKFSPVENDNQYLGFTADNYWVRFTIENRTPVSQEYFLETARPITDLVELFIQEGAQVRRLQSGDKLPFSERALRHRKTMFRTILPPNSVQQFHLHILSDGEVVNLPLLLRSPESMMEITALEQFIFGLFYGILFLAAVIYLFFFFGMKERTFIYYAFYVIFIGLLQLALDGYFYQYVTPDAGVFSQRSVLIFATIGAFFLGRYSQVFLRIKMYSKLINRMFDGVYVMLAFTMLFLLVADDIRLGYPIANILGLVVLVLIICSLTLLYSRKIEVDRFFTVGIFFLVAGFVIFILNNFGQIENSFISQNSSKFGTGLEVIFLSLSMANLIARLKSEREQFNHLALARAEEMNDMKTYFLSNISHELRTPLNAIMSMSTDLAQNAEKKKMRRKAEIIQYSSHSLLSSVNDILDFSKIEKGELRLTNAPFDLLKSIEPVKVNAESRALDGGLGFVFSFKGIAPGQLIGDEQRLVQIISNVISNAIKFSPEGTITFEVEARPVSQNRSAVSIVVSDNGIGIPKEKMHNIFEAFTQEKINNKRKFGGLGLGLYIVKTLVDLQGGTIDIQSTPGKGTTCRINLEFEMVAASNQEPAPEVEEFDLCGKTILVVEDNAINQMVIKMITKKWLNVEVFYTNNGQECLDALAQRNFDLILMDLQMPVLDGYEATIAIRNGEAGENYRHIPIVAVTADVMETTKERVVEIGMDGYLAKPLKNESLFEVVKQLLIPVSAEQTHA